MIGLPAVAAAKPQRTDRALLVVGQSLATPWYSQPIRNAFVATRRRRGDRSAWSFVVHARDGSAALREFCGSVDDNWWYDLDTKSAGPVLADAVRAIRKAKNKPTEVLWVQGQQEGGVLGRGPRYSMPDGRFKRRYKNAVLSISRELRKAAAGKDWRSIPFYIQTLGTRVGGDTRGDVLVRECQLELVAEKGASWNLSLGGVQPHDLPLMDHVHPNRRGDAIMGRLNARAISLTAPSPQRR